MPESRRQVFLTSIYSAFMFFCTGALVIAGNVFFLPLFFFYWIFIAVLMKGTEERWLKDLYGREYGEYCRRVLKPGGILIAPTFTAAGSLSGRMKIRIMELSGFQVFHKWTPEAYLDFLKENGFEITRGKTYGGVLKLTYAEARVKGGAGLKGVRI